MFFAFFPRPQATPDIWSCEIESWCPIEVDSLPLGKTRGALMAKSADYTVFIKNSVAFPYFGDEYTRNNLISNRGRPCLYKKDDPDHGCQIFRLGDMVELAGGNFTRWGGFRCSAIIGEGAIALPNYVLY